MPWTFAHPAAVLPFWRRCPRYLSFPALIVGSMSPDLGYYFNQFALASFAHTFSGTLLLCLPSGLTLLVLLYALRNPICLFVPEPHRGALTEVSRSFGRMGFLRLATISLSVLIGSWTHILWDSFTHNERWASNYFALLREPLFQVGGSAVHGYQVLQHLSTVVGLFLLAASYWVWLRQYRLRESERASSFVEERGRWILISALVGMSIVVAIPLALSESAFETGFLAFRIFVFRTVVYGTAIFLSMFVVTAIFRYVRTSADG